VLQIDEIARVAEALAGVRRTTADGLAQWRYHGRLVARQLDDAHVVIRADFDYRASVLRQFPETFSATWTTRAMPDFQEGLPAWDPGCSRRPRPDGASRSTIMAVHRQGGGTSWRSS
jgi:hypothetical protein